MIDAAKKRSLFFDDYDNQIQSEKPSLKPGLPDKYRSLANELRNEHDSDFVDFVQVSIDYYLLLYGFNFLCNLRNAWWLTLENGWHPKKLCSTLGLPNGNPR